MKPTSGNEPHGLDPARQLAIVAAIAQDIAGTAAAGSVLDRALETVCDLLGLTTGWIFTFDEETLEPSLAAVRHLPPAFETEPDRWEGLCYCVQAVIEGSTEGAANIGIIGCSRLYRLDERSADGLQYHASIPLYAGTTCAGIMNVARPGWQQLTATELGLLTTIGHQLGFVIERSRLADRTARRAGAEERQRVAMELHDTLLQGLTGVGLQLEAAEALIGRDAAAALDRLRSALSLNRTTIAETRAAIQDLGPTALQQQDLSHALAGLCDAFAGLHGIVVECAVPASTGGLPEPVSRGIYRVVSEGLNNVVKHAGASHVLVRLTRHGGRLSLVIADDGRGFERGGNPGALHGYGLHSMRRRVRMIGGRFRLITAPGKGTRVEASIPVRAERARDD